MRTSSFRRGALAALAAAVLLTAGAAPASANDAEAAAKRYPNCKALNAVYRHGVGKPGARDHVRGSTRPVTNFYRNAALYTANRHLDGDRDQVACEKR
jgi:hypothetical protein